MKMMINKLGLIKRRFNDEEEYDEGKLKNLKQIQECMQHMLEMLVQF